MTVRGVMDVLPGKPIYIHILNMRAKPENLPKFVIVTCASNAPTFMIHLKDAKPHMLTDECPITTQCDKLNFYPNINAVRYELPERHDEQVNCHNNLEPSDDILKIEWRKDLTQFNEYTAYSDKFINMLT